MRELNLHKLRKNLNCLCTKLHKEYEINLGGCCYLAYLIAKEFDKLQIPYSLVVCTYTYKIKSKVKKELKKRFPNTGIHSSITGNYACYHYFLYMKNIGYINYDSDRYRYSFDVTSKDIGFIYKYGCWNSTYETSNNKKIAKIINLHFKQYEKIRSSKNS